jgi:hypothetical protein
MNQIENRFAPNFFFPKARSDKEFHFQSNAGYTYKYGVHEDGNSPY